MIIKKINISFIMYGGLSYGGAHRQAMNLAKVLDKNVFNVRYFWCRPGEDKYSTFSFPELNLNFLSELRQFGVETIEFSVGFRDISKKNHPWFESDFFDIFKKYPTDIVFSVRSGHAEYPFVHINKPIIEWNVFGGVDKNNNIIYSVSVSPWVLSNYISRGGDKEKSGYCFTGVPNPLSCLNLRKELGIGDDELVLGFHQRVDDHIFGEHALRAWGEIKNIIKERTVFVILGGSKKYQDLAKSMDLPVKFLPVSPDYVFVSKFLNTLDIFVHSGRVGETLGLVIEEAMMHGLPVVSMKSKYNGHVDVIGNVISVADDFNNYKEILLKLITDVEYRIEVAEKSKKRAIEEFSFEKMKIYFEDLFIQKYKEYCVNQNIDFSIQVPDIHNTLDIRSIMYRLLYKHPHFLNFVLNIRNFVLSKKNKI